MSDKEMQDVKTRISELEQSISEHKKKMSREMVEINMLKMELRG